MLTVWVDADNCVREARDLVERSAHKGRVRAVMVANRPVKVAAAEGVEVVRVSEEDQASDRYIRSHVQVGDIAITRDIPLAAELLEQGLTVLNDRGTVWDAESVRERLSMRDFMQNLRERGLAPRSLRSYDKRDAAAFAAALDREVSKAERSRQE